MEKTASRLPSSESKTASELEAARVELRGMFADRPDSFTDAWLSGLSNQPRAVVRVRGAHFFGDSFSECIAKARQWKERTFGQETNTSVSDGTA